MTGAETTVKKKKTVDGKTIPFILWRTETAIIQNKYKNLEINTFI